MQTVGISDLKVKGGASESGFRGGSKNRFLEDSGFSKELLSTLLDSAEAIAEMDASRLKNEAKG